MDLDLLNTWNKQQLDKLKQIWLGRQFWNQTFYEDPGFKDGELEVLKQLLELEADPP